jgi:hypothetical protein
LSHVLQSLPKCCIYMEGETICSLDYKVHFLKIMRLGQEGVVARYGMQHLNTSRRNLSILLSNPPFLTMLPSEMHLEWLILLINLAEVEHPMIRNRVLICM